VSYTVILMYDPEYEGYVASVPALPGCVTNGHTLEEAIAMAKDAIGLYVESLREHGEPVPAQDRPPVVTMVEAA
jgi:predicted RNase H-like HicB family nuclease